MQAAVVCKETQKRSFQQSDTYSSGGYRRDREGQNKPSPSSPYSESEDPVFLNGMSTDNGSLCEGEIKISIRRIVDRSVGGIRESVVCIVRRLLVRLMNRTKERDEARAKMQTTQKQVEDLEYALQTLLKTGTVIPQELDDRIQDAIEGTRVPNAGEDIFL